MPMQKRTYALPAETVQRFEQQVEPSQRSTVIAELLHEWLDNQRREQLRQDIIEGCRDMAEIDLEIEAAYYPLDEEVWRTLDT